LAHIRGKLQKKVWINAGDIILVGDFLLLLWS
jgi:initiation factor 1A